ncbi:chemotaxis protein CheX [Marinicellulosiphila megalodicopiae]|uniref:chemotaxis protein CheX n=1 Tax=Marinicellulosiphila megalodicopiae TaxID=2724896 RepID=UPI003BB0496B
MDETQIQVFVDGVLHFFKQLNIDHIDVGTPYLMENQNATSFDLTGVIGISGPKKGCVYFSSPVILLKHLLLKIGEKDTSEHNLLDLVGEVANTISGNARRAFGSEFMISVPLSINGTPDQMHLPAGTRSYVIPIYWKAYSAVVVVCVQ